MVEWAPFGKKSLDFISNPISEDAWITILEGSVRSSKTVTMIPKWLIYIKQAPPGLLLMTGVSKETIYDNVLADIFDTVGTDSYTYNTQTGKLILFGRDIRVIGAKDEGSEKYLRGKTLAGAYSDEATLLPEKFFKQLLNRLSVKGAKLYMTTNPDTPSHYLYTGYITDQKQIDSGAVRVIHFELDDNPNLDEGYKSMIRGAYKGLFYDRMILGLWVMGEGAIFDCLTDENYYTHLPMSAWELERCTHLVSVDVGTQNAQVYLLGIDDGDTLWINDEYYYSGRESIVQKTHAEYGDDFDKFVEKYKNPNGSSKISKIILDPSAASFKAELRNRGYRVKDADNEVIEGIRWMLSVIGSKKVKINKTKCPNLIRQMQSYRWDPKPTEKGKEQPIKKDDDCCDAKRYMVKEIFTKRRIGEL